MMEVPRRILSHDYEVVSSIQIDRKRKNRMEYGYSLDRDCRFAKRIQRRRVKKWPLLFLDRFLLERVLLNCVVDENFEENYWVLACFRVYKLIYGPETTLKM